MRGRPLLQWALFALAWAILLVPIVRVTRSEHSAAAPAAPDAGSVTTWVSLRFSVIPESFTLRQGGVVVWQQTTTDEREFEQALPLTVDAFGTEFSFSAGLPEGAAAIEVSVEPDGRPARSRTVWANGDVDALLAFSWRPHD